MKGTQGERINRSAQECRRRIISEALSETGFNFVLPAGACPSRLSLPLFTSTFWAKGCRCHIFPITVLLLFHHTLDSVTWLNQHTWHRSLSCWWKATLQPSAHRCQPLPVAGDEHSTGLRTTMSSEAKRTTITGNLNGNFRKPNFKFRVVRVKVIVSLAICLSQSLLFSHKDRLECGDVPDDLVQCDGDGVDDVSLFFQSNPTIRSSKEKKKCPSNLILILYRSIQELGIWANFSPKMSKKQKKQQLLYKISQSESESYVSPTLGYWFFFAQPVGRDYCEMIKWEVLEEIETFFLFFFFFFLSVKCCKLWWAERFSQGGLSFSAYRGDLSLPYRWGNKTFFMLLYNKVVIVIRYMKENGHKSYSFAVIMCQDA